MSRGSIRYIDTTYIYGQQVQSAPVSNPVRSSVVYGRFPGFSTKKSPIEKLNKVLFVFLMILIGLSALSYYFVADGENAMNKLGREIVALNNENIELQSKIDNLHSFNRVDSIIQGGMSLDIAKKVMEVPAENVANATLKDSVPVNYIWNIGY